MTNEIYTTIVEGYDALVRKASDAYIRVNETYDAEWKAFDALPKEEQDALIKRCATLMDEHIDFLLLCSFYRFLLLCSFYRSRADVDLQLTTRAAGACLCAICGREYWRHPVATESWNLSFDTTPFLHRLCNGHLVKL